MSIKHPSSLAAAEQSPASAPKTSVAGHGTENSAAALPPAKADGTVDMRYKASQEAVAAGLVEPDVPLEAQNDSNAKVASSNTVESAVENAGEIPTTADGTADMRYNVSKDAVDSGEISCDQVLGGAAEIESSLGGQ